MEAGAECTEKEIGPRFQPVEFPTCGVWVKEEEPAKSSEKERSKQNKGNKSTTLLILLEFKCASILKSA